MIDGLKFNMIFDILNSLFLYSPHTCNDAAVIQFVFGHTSLESSKKMADYTADKCLILSNRMSVKGIVN